MIEKMNAEELAGQLELEDLLPQEAESTEGYDAEGNLMDADAETACGPDYCNIEDEGKLLAGDDAEGRLERLAVEINAITEQTRGVVISAALAVGRRLVEAKSLCPEGRFGEWLERSVNYSERKAQDMMRLYVEYGRDGAVPESIAALDYSKAVALLAAPAEAREALAERAREEELSVRGLQEEIKRLKAEKARDQMRIDGLEAHVRQARETADQLTAQGHRQDQAIVDQGRQLEEARAKAAAAEASADELRKLHSAAEDRAAASAQRANDAVNRANQTAKDLAEARATIARLEAEAAAAPEPEPRTVEVVPEDVRRELETLRAQLAEARTATTAAPAEPREASAVEKFKWFYANQMKSAFATALSLLREVAREDGKAADMFATALVNGCKQLMRQLGSD